MSSLIKRDILLQTQILLPLFYTFFNHILKSNYGILGLKYEKLCALSPDPFDLGFEQIRHLDKNTIPKPCLDCRFRHLDRTRSQT